MVRLHRSITCRPSVRAVRTSSRNRGCSSGAPPVMSTVRTPGLRAARGLVDHGGVTTVQVMRRWQCRQLGCAFAQIDLQCLHRPSPDRADSVLLERALEGVGHHGPPCGQPNALDLSGGTLCARMDSAGDHHVAAAARAAAGGLIGSTQEVVQGLSALASCTPDAHCESEASLGRLEHHALDGLAEALTDGVGILLDGQRNQGDESIGPFSAATSSQRRQRSISVWMAEVPRLRSPFPRRR